MKDLREKILYVIVAILVIFLLIYIFSSCFRNFLSKSNLDPNFLVAFATLITLIISYLSNRKERKFNFNLHLKNSMQEKVELVIGKLLTIMNDSSNYLETIKDIKNAIDKDKKFIDLNNVLSLDDLKKDKELIGSYITIYFSQYIQDDWNLMTEKINKIANNCSNVLSNYNENYNLIGTQNFKNEAISNIDEIIKESEILNKEIYELTEKMKNILLLDIVIKNDKEIREKYLN